MGAASNPFVPPFDWRPLRLAKKVEAGADFIQTQYCYDVPRLRNFLGQVCDMGLDEKGAYPDWRWPATIREGGRVHA